MGGQRTIRRRIQSSFGLFVSCGPNARQEVSKRQPKRNFLLFIFNTLNDHFWITGCFPGAILPRLPSLNGMLKSVFWLALNGGSALSTRPHSGCHPGNRSKSDREPLPKGHLDSTGQCLFGYSSASLGPWKAC